MPGRSRNESFDDQPRDFARQYPPLPQWLARRLLRREEHIIWVRGPWHDPYWERYATHPFLFVVALALGAVCFASGVLIAGPFTALSIVAAGAIVFGSVFVLALSNAYFTRLVVTNNRVFIVQGYEICRCWGIDDLPRSFIRYGRMADGARDRTVDLDAVKTLLGGASDKFAESKSILKFGKQLDRIKTREDDRP